MKPTIGRIVQVINMDDEYVPALPPAEFGEERSEEYRGRPGPYAAVVTAVYDPPPGAQGYEYAVSLFVMLPHTVDVLHAPVPLTETEAEAKALASERDVTVAYWPPRQ